MSKDPKWKQEILETCLCIMHYCDEILSTVSVSVESALSHVSELAVPGYSGRFESGTRILACA